MESKTLCRVCGGKTNVSLDMGELYPSMFLGKNDPLPEKMSMVLVKCQDCGLIQLEDTPDLDSMYRQYFYRSGINPHMVHALRDVVESATERVPIKEGDIVVDIGANDGTLLSMYPKNVVKVAYEPALNIVEDTKKHANVFINDYFSADAYPLREKAKIVTSLAMFYDLPDPVKFAKDVAQILDDDGIWIMQISDLRSMFETNSIDNPCFEHLEYYAMSDILGIVDRAGMVVFHVEHNDVNSGSLRYYICHEGRRKIEVSVWKMFISEVLYLNSPDGTMEAFAERVDNAKTSLLNWLSLQKELGKKVYALGASTKGNTLLQYFGIDETMITAVGDLNKEKFGKRMIGSNIPIISEKKVLEAKPDYIIILAWHFLDFFFTKLSDYLKAGGAIVTPLPEPKMFVLDSDGYLVEIEL